MSLFKLSSSLVPNLPQSVIDECSQHLNQNYIWAAFKGSTFSRIFKSSHDNFFKHRICYLLDESSHSYSNAMVFLTKHLSMYMSETPIHTNTLQRILDEGRAIDVGGMSLAQIIAKVQSAVDGSTLLHFAAQEDTVCNENNFVFSNSWIPSIQLNRYDLGSAKHVDALIQAGADVNAKMTDGTTPLHLASSAQKIASLAKAGADVDATAAGGLTPLHVAAGMGDRGNINALLQSGANTNTVNCAGEIPLHHLVHFVNHTLFDPSGLIEKHGIYGCVDPEIENVKCDLLQWDMFSSAADLADVANNKADCTRPNYKGETAYDMATQLYFSSQKKPDSPAKRRVARLTWSIRNALETASCNVRYSSFSDARKDYWRGVHEKEKWFHQKCEDAYKAYQNAP